MQYVFVDTNFFIQYKSYHEIDWNELFSEPVHIIILRQVLRELDNHKNSNNKRRQKRARSTISLLRQLRSGPVEKKVHGKTVVMSLVDRFNTSEKKYAFLDFQKPDDCIANEILHWADANPNSTYCAVTGDIGLLTTCDDCSVPCLELPKGWLRSPEPDERDNRIRLLEKQVSLLEETKPCLTIDFSENLYEIEVKHYVPPTEEAVKKAFDQICGAFPKENITLDERTSQSKLKDNSSLPCISRMVQWNFGVQERTLTQGDVEKYDEAYTQWRRNLSSALEELPHKIKTVRTIFNMQFKLQNIGNAPAEDLILEIEMTGGLSLLTKDSAELPWGYEKVDLPSPPKPPQKYHYKYATPVRQDLFNNDLFNDLSHRRHKLEKEPDIFYYEPVCPTEPQEAWEFSCVEFRHQREPEMFNLRVLVPETGLDRELKATVHVYSRQLAKPISKTVSIRPVVGKESFNKRLEEIVDNYIDWHKKKGNKARSDSVWPSDIPISR